ncbi:MAG: hypothetical protein HYX71_06235 [Opitutae bacterium]|nr:hypothetical protein [Opitutae bacterium]
MKSTLPRILLLIAFPLISVSLQATNAVPAAPPPDAVWRQSILGTWLHEKNVGVATAALYTTYRADGTAIELLKLKFLLKKPTGVWTEYRWHIENGRLHMMPVRSRSSSDDTQVDLEEIVRQLVRVDSKELFFRRKGKERQEHRATIPADVQKMIGDLSQKQT